MPACLTGDNLISSKSFVVPLQPPMRELKTHSYHSDLSGALSDAFASLHYSGFVFVAFYVFTFVRFKNAVVGQATTTGH